jgi:hypothetical protein
MLFLTPWTLLLLSISTSALPSVHTSNNNNALPLTARSTADNVTDHPSDDKHNYTFDELKPDIPGLGSNPQPYFRFLLLFKKKPGISEDYFHQHWGTVHADLTMASVDVGVQLTRYVQVIAYSPFRRTTFV